MLPRDGVFDDTLALLRDGYLFVGNRLKRFCSEAFETRLMLRKTVCVGGEAAARMFYEPGRFTRRGAIPPTTLMLLQDKGSVATLDGEAHHHRKGMFLSLMTDESVSRLAALVREDWRAQLPRWRKAEEVVLLDEVRLILCRAVCRWAGIPVEGREAERRAREFGAMIDGAGSVGPRNWRGLVLRARTERWAKAAIEQVRDGQAVPKTGSALEVIANHRDEAGRLLPASTAAIELINVLRPTVAIERYVVFAALAMHEHPTCLPKLVVSDEAYIHQFAQEVRRFFPFFPLVSGRAMHPFQWKGHAFRAGDWVILDLYGSNHDTHGWTDPEAFRPERHAEFYDNTFNFIPQGGGHHHDGHRCPGEWITLAILRETIGLLAHEMQYEVPAQDLHIDLNRFPTEPRSRFIISRVRPMR